MKGAGKPPEHEKRAQVYVYYEGEYDILIISLTRDEKLELQQIAHDIKHKHEYLKALNTLDCSGFKLEAQLNHKLMILTERLKGNATMLISIPSLKFTRTNL